MIRTKPPNAPGIYQIQSIRNNKRYVGSAKSLRERKKTHFNDLQTKKHFNDHLQNHGNKYGLDDLVFSILEYCLKEKLIEREQHYIDTLNPEFNICKIANSQLGVKRTEKQKQKFQGKNNPMYGKIGEKNPRYGTFHSEETKIKMSKPRSEKAKKNMKGHAPWLKGLTKEIDVRIKKHSEAMKGNQLRKGFHHSEEQKELRSKKGKAWYKTEAGKAWKIKYTGEGNPSYGKNRTEEVKRKISAGQKKRWAKIKAKQNPC